MNFINELTIDDLDEEQRDLAECIGIDSYKRLITDYGGCTVTIRVPDGILRAIRNRHIKNDFNGYNYRALSVKYGLHEKTVRNIIRADTV